MMSNLSSRMLTVGISGATCSGKTSVAAMLENILPSCKVINQDTYYHEDDSIHHIKDKKTNLINWEVLEAFNMEKMHLDINHIRQKLTSSGCLSSNKLSDSWQLNNTNIRPIPVLIIEGIIIFRDPELVKQCDMKYFIEIDHDSCKSRRQSRVWDPEGSCWEENPEYFESIAWPEYQKCVEEIKHLDGISFLDSSTTSIQSNFEGILTDIIEKIKE